MLSPSSSITKHLPSPVRGNKQSVKLTWCERVIIIFFLGGGGGGKNMYVVNMNVRERERESVCVCVCGGGGELVEFS